MKTFIDFLKRHKNLLLAVVISCATYVFFYGSFLTPTHYFWGSDAQIEYVPARVYLYDKIINEHTFPFWTEKMFSGFPIYADLENAYLNPVNVASILVFGPELSYKILHVSEYLLGSLCFYFLLRRRDVGLLGFSVANLIFYFNTFFINHQIHFNIIMAFSLIPTAFLLCDLFIEKQRLRYIILQSFVIANAVLWGHMQSAIVLLFGAFVYLVVFAYQKMRLATFAFYFVTLMLLVTIETLPQVWSSYDLFTASSRSENLDYLKGSFKPQMAFFTVVPYLLGEHEHFIGKKINKGFTYTEIYIYLGISSVLLAALALLVLKKSREVILAYIFIWIFLLLGFMAYNKLFPETTPVITLFRDWGRTVVLASFGIALLVGILVEKLSEISWKHARVGIFFVLAPLLYLKVIDLLSREDIFPSKIETMITYQYIQSYPHFTVLRNIVLILLIVFIAFFLFKKYASRIFPKTTPIFAIAIVAIVFFDLAYFSQDVLDFRLQDISGYQLKTIPSELAYKRIAYSAIGIQGMEFLYYDIWSPYGYSQFKEDAYEKYFNRLGLGDIKISSRMKSKDNSQALQNAGIVAIAGGENARTISEKPLDLIKNNLEGEYIEKKEGLIVMRLDTPTDTTINTYLKYSPHWRVTVDDTNQVTPRKNGVFFDFPLSAGNHIVKITYFPRPFYEGVLASIILLLGTIALSYRFRKNIYSSLANLSSMRNIKI